MEHHRLQPATPSPTGPREILLHDLLNLGQGDEAVAGRRSQHHSMPPLLTLVSGALGVEEPALGRGTRRRQMTVHRVHLVDDLPGTGKRDVVSVPLEDANCALCRDQRAGR